MASILTAIFDVFSQVGQWIVTAVSDMVPIFYAEGSLTFLGVLATCGLAFSVALLVINVVKDFIHWR